MHVAALWLKTLQGHLCCFALNSTYIAIQDSLEDVLVLLSLDQAKPSGSSVALKSKPLVKQCCLLQVPIMLRKWSNIQRMHTCGQHLCTILHV